jgi:F-type H+-transporting ATPase subunit b
MTFNWWTFLFQLLNFLVLAYVLHRLLYQPLHRAIDERRKAEGQARAEAEAERKQAQVLQEELRQQLEEQECQRQEVLRQAHDQAAAERQKLLAEAEQNVQRRQEEVRQALARESDEARRALRMELLSQAVEAAGRLLGEAADTTLNRQLALKLAETLEGIPEDERRRLQEQGQMNDGALLETASMLDDETCQRIAAAVTALAGRTVAPAVQTNPALLGGVRLRLGGHVWDASLAGQLEAVNRG